MLVRRILAEGFHAAEVERFFDFGRWDALVPLVPRGLSHCRRVCQAPPSSNSANSQPDSAGVPRLITFSEPGVACVGNLGQRP
jgi:hypothetical protein